MVNVESRFASIVQGMNLSNLETGLCTYCFFYLFSSLLFSSMSFSSSLFLLLIFPLLFLVLHLINHFSTNPTVLHFFPNVCIHLCATNFISAQPLSLFPSYVLLLFESLFFPPFLSFRLILASHFYSSHFFILSPNALFPLIMFPHIFPSNLLLQSLLTFSLLFLLSAALRLAIARDDSTIRDALETFRDDLSEKNLSTTLRRISRQTIEDTIVERDNSAYRQVSLPS